MHLPPAAKRRKGARRNSPSHHPSTHTRRTFLTSRSCWPSATALAACSPARTNGRTTGSQVSTGTAAAVTDGFVRPAGAPADAPGYHLSAPTQWMNDPQRPIFLGGTWSMWYLHNADHPTGNGTDWRRATSTDLVSWHDAGTSIRKYTDRLGDIESGSAVVDVSGSAGLGAGAVVAMATQQADGVQRQSLFVSHDGGATFTPVPGNPVIDNPGTQAGKDFRDPKIIRDDAHAQWVMVLAEGHRLGFYTSTDLRRWTYRSDVAVAHLGVLECPDLFALDLDGDPDRRTWVLMASANGAARGRTTGVAYWTGTWDGTRFEGDGAAERWLDHGPDFYAAVTWEDGTDADPARRHTSRLCLGWLNNWGYARDRRALSRAGGAQSIVRRIQLVSTPDGPPALHSRPVEALAGITGAPTRLLDPTRLAAGSARRVSRPTPSDSLRIDVDARVGGAAELRIVLHGLDGGTATLGVDGRTSRAFVSRAPGTGAPRSPVWSGPHGAPVHLVDGRVVLQLHVDRDIVEAFTPDGTVLSAATDLGELVAIELAAVGGPVDVTRADATPLRPVQLAPQH